VREVLILVNKEFRLEVRQSYALMGVVLYILSTVYVCYLSFQSLEQQSTWNALIWIIVLFASFNALGRSFASDTRGRNIYLYTLVHPRHIIASKLLYNVLTMFFLGALALFFYAIFLGTQVLAQADLPQFLVAYLGGAMAFATVLTLISAIASTANNSAGLMALLGFPVVIPFLIVIMDITGKALNNMPWSENTMNFVILGGIMALALVLSNVLFPYLWRD
jgi:heme exporter protein B